MNQGYRWKKKLCSEQGPALSGVVSQAKSVFKCLEERPRTAETWATARLVTVPLFLQLDVAWFPGLVEPWLERTVQTQDREPSSAGYRLDPVGLFTDWGLRTEVDLVGTICVFLDSGALTSFRGKLLVSLCHGARLCVEKFLAGGFAGMFSL
jgi:hypothetical protein